MKKICKRLVCSALLVLAAFLVLSVSGLAVGEAITPGTGVEINSAEMSRLLYTFTPEVSGIYEIESYGSVDTVVTLYDAQGNELAYSDDINGDNLNFSLRYSFTAGATYYFELDAYTHFTPRTVTVLLKAASAIDKDSIENVSLTFGSVFEGLSGSVDIFDVRGDFFRYSYKVLGVEILLKNGESITCTADEVTALTGLVLSVKDSQSYDSQWKLGENEVDVSLGAYKGKAVVTVMPNNLEKITVPDRSVIAYTNGRSIKGSDGSEWYRYSSAYPGRDIEVIIGGEKITGSVDEIFEQTGFAFSFSDDQSAENIWGIGNHRVDYTFMGHSGSYTLTVTESPVESIEIQKLTLIENCDGIEPDEGASYFHYHADRPGKVKVILKDGSELTGTCDELARHFGYDFIFEDIQSAAAPLTVGKYKMKYSFMAFDGEYDVEIIPCPVKSISVKNVNLFYESEGTYYYNDEGKRVFYYESAPTEMTVSFKDGSSVSGNAEGIEELTGYKVHINDSQDSTPWGVGEFESSLKLMGFETDYRVKISASPVKSVTIESIQLYEGADGRPADDGNGYIYDARPEKITVIYKDGSAAYGDADEIEKQTGFKVYYPEGQNWSCGKHTATATFMGVKASYSVTVNKNPVAGIEFINADSEREYIEGQLYDLTGAELKVSYSDGSSEKCAVKHNPYNKTASVYLKKLGRDFSFNADVRACAGKDEAQYVFFGYTVEADFDCVTRELTGLELIKAEGESPIISFTLDDASKINAELLCIAGADYIYGADVTCKKKAVVLVTDRGCFDALVSNGPDGTKLRLEELSSGELSVRLHEGMAFASTAVTEKARLIYNYCDIITSFEGTLTRSNADVLMSLAAALSDKGAPKEIYGDYYVFARTEIEKSLKDIFRLHSIDVRLSFNYNTGTDTVRVEKLNGFRNPLYGCVYGVDYSTELTADSGCLRAVCKFTDGGEAEFIFDAEGRIEGYTVLEPLAHRHTPVARFGSAATYFSQGYTDSVTCSGCGKAFIPRKTIAKKTLGKTAKIASAQSTSAIKLQWQAVKDATGYEVFYKKGSVWKRCTVTSATTVTYSNLPAGTKYTFAVRAYLQQNGKTVKAPSYTTFETATKTVAPSKITSKQNTSAIQLNWTACKGASGYRIYYKKAGKWLVGLDSTTKTTHTFYGLKPGTKVTYAVRPYIKTADGIIWSDYTTYTSATKPAVPVAKATSTAKGTINFTFGKVNGAQSYQIYYKNGNGSYKLYKTYTAPVSCSFKNLKSATSYTFAVRAGIKTSGGWVYGSYTPVTVKVK